MEMALLRIISIKIIRILIKICLLLISLWIKKIYKIIEIILAMQIEIIARITWMEMGISVKELKKMIL